tara:strand:- start:3149 stop:3928 length:780 start_codon:yes stop_codon:yes gene_type:complete
MTEEYTEISYKNKLNENFNTFVLITFISFFMTCGNGFSILYYIVTKDAIQNENMLNDDVIIDNLETMSDLYLFFIVVSLIILVLAHGYGTRNILRCFSSFIPCYFIYICIFNILFISYHIIHSSDPCKKRGYFNCSKFNNTEVNNDSIYESIDILALFLIISIITTFITVYISDKYNFKELMKIVLFYGFIVVSLPIIIMFLFIFSGCDDCACDGGTMNIHERRAVTKASRNAVDIVNNKKKNKVIYQIDNIDVKKLEI